VLKHYLEFSLPPDKLLSIIYAQNAKYRSFIRQECFIRQKFTALSENPGLYAIKL
jgi:hypothetical protein